MLVADAEQLADLSAVIASIGERLDLRTGGGEPADNVLSRRSLLHLAPVGLPDYHVESGFSRFFTNRFLDIQAIQATFGKID